MATDLDIDPALIDRALLVSGERTNNAVVTRALEEFIARRRQRDLLAMFGQIEWDPRYDVKAQRLRARRSPSGSR
jgi:hypothetical protein